MTMSEIRAKPSVASGPNLILAGAFSEELQSLVIVLSSDADGRLLLEPEPLGGTRTVDKYSLK